MMHEGPYDHGIATKNRALSLGADMMVAGKMGEYKVGTAENKITISQFNVELYRCPDSAFEEEKSMDNVINLSEFRNFHQIRMMTKILILHLNKSKN